MQIINIDLNNCLLYSVISEIYSVNNLEIILLIFDLLKVVAWFCLTLRKIVFIS